MAAAGRAGAVRAGAAAGAAVAAGVVGAAGVKPGTPRPFIGMAMARVISGVAGSGSMPRIGAMREITIPAAGAATQPAVAKPWLCAFGFGSSTMT